MVNVGKIVNNTIDTMTKLVQQNRYSLKLDGLNQLESISVLSVDIQEQLNQPWRYCITFTSPNRALSVDQILSQPASFSFLPPTVKNIVQSVSSLETPPSARTLYGVVTGFSQLSVNQEEARYQVILVPRLALLANSHNSAIYQNQSVVSVVESVLRRHGFTGVDYRLALKNNYPNRELITQWQESDLAFILRLLADVGIWLRFESHPKHNCDVIVMSDDEQGLANHGVVIGRTPSGMGDSGRHSVWGLQSHSQTVIQSVGVNDYNYRKAQANMQSQVNRAANDTTTRGHDYRYGEHYRNQTADEQDEMVESGEWYATIRHQHAISHQRIIHGKSNDYTLAPGHQLSIEDCDLADIENGIIILTTHGYADRSAAYEVEFTAIVFDRLKPYRPAPLPFPTISGTLPAKITSPDNDTYGYIDIQGRYRVKFAFDLASWPNGEESLWVRLAKPYAGDHYGIHFPLIDGTEVAIAFTDGNPDRPYIAYAMHNSTHPDHVATANKHRNVIRTPANNKLRMDDKRGQEHIKLATEYGKTQLNIGHLVNQNKEQRGEGFELRTDEWGAIRAGKGLYITTESKPKASGEQLDMRAAVAQLESALQVAKVLAQAAENSGIDAIDTSTQQDLKDSLNRLTQAGMLLDAPAGVGIVTPKDIQFSANDNIRLTANQNSYISVMKKIALTAGESIGLFASKLGIKLFAVKGKVELQAQTNAMDIMAKKNISIVSTNDEIEIMAQKAITIKCQGAYIKLANGSVEIGCPGGVIYKSGSVSYSSAGSQSGSASLKASNLANTNLYSQQFRIIDERTKEPRAFVPYRIEVSDGEIIRGISDENGYTERIYGMSKKNVKIIIEG